MFYFECRDKQPPICVLFLDCPACYNLIQDAVNDIRQRLLDLANTLKNINENPNVADDVDFTNRLNQLKKEIDDLLRAANDLKSECLFYQFKAVW